MAKAFCILYIQIFIFIYYLRAKEIMFSDRKAMDKNQ